MVVSIHTAMTTLLTLRQYASEAPYFEARLAQRDDLARYNALAPLIKKRIAEAVDWINRNSRTASLSDNKYAYDLLARYTALFTQFNMLHPSQPIQPWQQ